MVGTLNMHKCDVAVVAVHLFEEMPDAGPDQAKYIRWKMFSDLIVNKVRELPWPIIYQLDYIDSSWYYKNAVAKLDNCFFGRQQPNSNLVIQSKDFVSTSNAQTRQLIQTIDPAIVMICGLHKDYCVQGVKLDVYTEQREYFVSEHLSFTRLETAMVVDHVEA